MSYYRADDVTEYVRENDVKFVRMQFCDMEGNLRNLSIMPGELDHALSEGIMIESARVEGFNGLPGEDIFLRPDPVTMAVLPWRPQQGRVVRLFCDILSADGSHYVGDSRHILKEASAKLSQKGLVCEIGMECSFTLFELDERGNPTFTPHDRADAFAVAPLDKGENVRREICLALEEMGVEPRSSCHAEGPGQHEIGLRAKDALTAADHYVTFVSATRTIAARNGLHATFMPKPLPEAHGNRLRLNLSLVESVPGMAGGFFAGICNGTGDMGAFLNPTTNAYERQRASHPNVMRLRSGADGERSLELMNLSPGLNAYLAFALIQAAGLNGIEGSKALEEDAATGAKLPVTLENAIACAKISALCRDTLGEPFLSAYLGWQRDMLTEWQNADEPKIDWERGRFFLKG